MVNEKIKEAEENTNITPTEGQKKAGNYKKGRCTIRGFAISIENPKGSIRAGRDEDGNLWSNKQKSTYGYFNNTIGKDKDQVDVYLGDYTETFESVYIIDQIHPKTGTFDEHKVMFGYNNTEQAKKAYLSNYEKGWKGLGAITSMNIKDFKGWLFNKKLTSKPLTNIRYKMMAEKMAHIKLEGEVLDGVTLKNLQSQVPKSFTHLVMEVTSPGGSVSEGLEIMKWLDELATQGVYIVSVVMGNAYSIASMIVLPAHLRIINKYGEFMVHNPMTPELKNANASELEEEASALRQLEGAMYEIYSVFTKLSTEEIKSLMDNETFFGFKDAIKYGFSHEVVDFGKKEYSMLLSRENTNNLNKKSMNKAINLLNRVTSLISGSQVVNQLYHTLEGDDIEIYQKEPDMPLEGDKTNVQEGIVTLGNGSVITIKDYEIVKKEEAVVEQPVEEPVAEEVIEVPVEESITEPVVEDEPVAELPVEGEEEKVAEFNEGDAPVEEEKVAELPIEEPVVEPVAEEVIEPAAEPLITEPGMVEPLVTPAPVVEETPEEKLSKLQESVDKKIAEITKAKDEQIETLKGQVKLLQTNSEALGNSIAKLEENLTSHKDNSAKFENAVAQAVDKIASGTSSLWMPEARAVQKASQQTGSSIFQNIMSQKKAQ